MWQTDIGNIWGRVSNIARDWFNQWPLTTMFGVPLSPNYIIKSTLTWEYLGKKCDKPSLVVLRGRYQHKEGWPSLMAIGGHVLESPSSLILYYGIHFHSGTFGQKLWLTNIGNAHGLLPISRGMALIDGHGQPCFPLLFPYCIITSTLNQRTFSTKMTTWPRQCWSATFNIGRVGLNWWLLADMF